MDMEKMLENARFMEEELKNVQKKLATMEVQVTDSPVKVTMTCDGKVTGLRIDEHLLREDNAALEHAIIDSVNKAHEMKDEWIKIETREMMKNKIPHPDLLPTETKDDQETSH